MTENLELEMAKCLAKGEYTEATAEIIAEMQDLDFNKVKSQAETLTQFEIECDL